MKNKVNLTLLLFAFAIQLSFAQSNLQQTASISIYADSILGEVNRNILGTNITAFNSQWYVLSPTFKSRMNELKNGPVRWPEGNSSGIYNWKIDGLFRDTLGMSWGLNIMEIAKLCDDIGANLQIVVNFGTMNAQDAADLVEFCNGPVTSKWGHIRDSLGHPEPFNVKYWEIGNELDAVHMWHYSWSAQHARKYFFGGSEERRGLLPPVPGHTRFKGDLGRSRGLPNQKHLIRFPDVAVGSDSVWVDPDTSSIVLWTRVADLDSVGAGNYYEMDYENSVLKFGDGIHGNIPPSGYYCRVNRKSLHFYKEFLKLWESLQPA